MPRDTSLIPEPLFEVALFDARVFMAARGESETQFYEARRRGDVPEPAVRDGVKFVRWTGQQIRTNLIARANGASSVTAAAGHKQTNAQAAAA